MHCRRRSGRLASGEVDLDDPATTVALLKLNAVVGVEGEVQTVGGEDRLVSVGITCALCHSTVDNSFASGIGNRLDGWPNRDLNVGAIIALSPAIPEAQKAVFNSWGSGKVRSALQSGRAESASRDPGRVRAAHDPQRDLHGGRHDLVLEQIRGGDADARSRDVHRSQAGDQHRPESRPGHAEAACVARISAQPVDPGASGRKFRCGGSRAGAGSLHRGRAMLRVPHP